MQPSARLFLFRLRREIRRGILPLWVLEQLAEGPAYGYSLMERLKARHGAQLSVNPSTLYPTLARLRSAGLVRIFHGTTSRGPLRKYYELTQEGRELVPLIRSLWADVHGIHTESTAPRTTLHGAPA